LKLHEDKVTGRNAFTGYGPGYVLINGERHETSVLVVPDTIKVWDVVDVASLDETEVVRLAALEAEVLLIGTGPRLQFPALNLLRMLAQAGIGAEIMDTPAACRTYNILMGEGRKVAAALILPAGGRPA
jgi:uncharacterized protein